MTPAAAERFMEKRVRGRPARAMVIPFGAVPLAEAGSRPLDPACAAGDPRGDPRAVDIKGRWLHFTREVDVTDEAPI